MAEVSETPNTPPDCFTLEALETFQQYEGRTLEAVNYYLWLNPGADGEASYRFLFYIELLFDDNMVLLLTSGEDSTAIHIGNAADLVDVAQQLKNLHDKITIQRVSANALPIWAEAVGKPLEAIRLSKNEDGLYWNDALLLDFDAPQILVELAKTEGLGVRAY
jgi:hypothetical protein